MKNFAATILIVFSQLILLAQCPPGDLFFSSQAQIDNFKITYPNCTEFDGSVIITGSGFVNLHGLSGLTSIEGDVQFLYVSGITNLFGLENLTSIGGDLIFLECYTLNNMMGLNNISSIGGELGIYNNTSLNNVNALNSLEFIGNSLLISANNSLTTITGMNNLVNVYGNVVIDENTLLASIEGLTSLSNVQGNFTLNSIDALPDLVGLESLTSIGGDLALRFNPVLENISALEGLTTIGGNLSIRSNVSLTTLSGLDNLDAGSINDLTIYSNTSLSTCEVLSICEYLASPNGNITITNNDTGCDSPEEVEGACAWVSVTEPGTTQDIEMYPNPANSIVTIELPSAPSNNTWLTLTTVNGQEVFRYQISEAKTGIDIKYLQAGIYIVKIQTGKDVITRKLVVS